METDDLSAMCKYIIMVAIKKRKPVPMHDYLTSPLCLLPAQPLSTSIYFNRCPCSLLLNASLSDF